MSAIVVARLSKCYEIGHEQRSDTLRDALSHGVKGLWRSLRAGRRKRTIEEFWALRDVSFTVEPGEVIGIIGRNGAGKSTLLKILSRITEPTRGEVRIRGRAASLLEVGTGFHPELTGRENIFLNGAILGMSRAEIRGKFDEIVAFAEIERFLDTPVKRYSSGMYVRLAFAVAAHLEPEILIVDEVLAVGDAAFQKKCLGKMQDVARTDGRTVLFVSHNLPAVRQFCQSAILLAAGALKASGPCGRILDLYQHGLDGAEPAKVPAPTPDLRTRAYATSMTVETLDGVATDTIPVGRPWRVRIGFRIAATQSKFVIAVGLRSGDGLGVQTAWLPPRQLTPGDYEAEFVQDRVVIEAGTYTVIVGLSEDDRSIQQFEGARIDLVAEGAVGFYVGTSGLGVVLNSMPSSLSKL